MPPARALSNQSVSPSLDMMGDRSVAIELTLGSSTGAENAALGVGRVAVQMSKLPLLEPVRFENRYIVSPSAPTNGPQSSVPAEPTSGMRAGALKADHIVHALIVASSSPVEPSLPPCAMSKSSRPHPTSTISPLVRSQPRNSSIIHARLSHPSPQSRQVAPSDAACSPSAETSTLTVSPIGVATLSPAPS